MDYKVTSEIYTEFDYTSSSKPKIDDKYVVSRFKFKCPPKTASADGDGDFIVSRKSDKQIFKTIEIEHSRSTALDLVGMQMWRGSLLLADWLISNAKYFPKECFILELAGGVGFDSIVASMFSPVIYTDVERGHVFKLMDNNKERNEKHINYPIKALELDFFTQIIPTYVVENIDKISVIIVAEVIYNDQLTDAFIQTVEHLLTAGSLEKTVYLAVEKRFVFTIADCESVAPCYEYFLKKLSTSLLIYEEVPIDFPQYFEYDRVKQLVLCKLKLKK
ncbi:hypothetical protein WA026_020903 [Henosepilachna vigintioctopunctata]|uniref:Methyltransferase-like protein 22 n=1 Tax=Henosepilachna vigintioctopunctata TaxID=420089 RepID=A0AAW1UNQ0_9CUCU